MTINVTETPENDFKARKVSLCTKLYCKDVKLQHNFSLFSIHILKKKILSLFIHSDSLCCWPS